MLLRHLSAAARQAALAGFGARAVSRFGRCIGGRSFSTSPYSYYSQNKGQDQEVAADVTEEPVEPPEDAIPYSFESTFLASKVSDIYSVQEGGYVDLDAKDIKHYFPEGMAGEMDAEFEHSGRKAWMIRDSAKLLCRLVDAFDATRKSKGQGSSSSSSSSSSNSSSSSSSSGGDSVGAPVVYKPVSLPNLTDRPEWSAASMSVTFFGSELMPAPADTIANPSRLRRTGLAGGAVLPEPTVAVARVDLCLARLREASGTDEVPRTIMLTGPRGVGKSAALNQMVMHARMNGWLCLFVPKGWDQVQSGDYVEPVTQLRGETARGVLDNPFMSAEVLRGLWKAHSALLNGMPLKFPREADRYHAVLAKFDEAYGRAKSVSGREKLGFRQMRAIVEGEDASPEQDALDAEVLDGFDYGAFRPALKSLGDLVRAGVAFRELAGSVLMDVVTELREVESVPVLVAVDQYNSWEAPSAFSFRSEVVHGRQICVPHSLHFVSKKKAQTAAWTLKNGLSVCATSLAHAEGRKETFETVRSSIPLVVRVPAYSRVEFLSAVTYYMHQRLIGPGTTTQELLAFRMLAGSNPFATRKEAVPFFFPINVAKLGSDITAHMGFDEEGEDDRGDGDGGDGGGGGRDDDGGDDLADSIAAEGRGQRG